MNQETGIIIDSTVLNSYKNGDACARKLILDAVDGDINISVSAVSIMNIWSRDTFDRKSEIGFTGIFSFLKIISLDRRVRALDQASQSRKMFNSNHVLFLFSHQ